MNTTTGIEVTQSTGQPTSGQSVVCDSTPPNPTAATTAVSAVAGSSNVSVTVLPGAIMNSTVRAIGVERNSSALNQGQITTTGVNAFGMSATGTGSTLTNQGSISTAGTTSWGMDARGSNTTIVNSGSISVSGAGSSGIRTNALNSSITNSGTITVTSTGAAPNFPSGVLFQAGSSGTFYNQAGGSISSVNGAGVRVVSDGLVTVRNAGTLTSDIGSAVRFDASNNVLILETGSVLNGDALSAGTGNTVRLQGTGSEDSNFIGATAGNGFQSLVMEGSNWTLSGNATITGTTANAVAVNSGTLVLGGIVTNSGVDGGTTIAPGATLQLGDGGATGTITGNIVDNGTLAFNRSDNLTFDQVVSGSGSLVMRGTGVLTLTAINTYGGPTVLEGGVLAFSRPHNLGTLGNRIIFDGGTLQLAAASSFIGRPVTVDAGGGAIDTNGFNFEYRGVASGTGPLTKLGGGRLHLTGNSTYSGTLTIAAGGVQLGNGGTSGSILGNIVNNGFLTFNRSDTFTVPGVISGIGPVIQEGTGNTILTGANSYLGHTAVLLGGLFVDGNQSAATGATSVASGATLGGTGTIGGSVSVADGGHLSPGTAGPAPGTLTIAQDLSLGSGSFLDYSFGQAGVVGGALNDLTVVGGNLTLDGTLNVTTPPGGSFDPGIYRVMSYAGSLTNNGLTVGTIPSPNFFLQTSVANEVNLVNTNGLPLNFWDGDAGPQNDGIVNGGDGTWQNSALDDNWTEQTGAINAPYQNGSFAIFAGQPGTVTVDNSLGGVAINGMQFASNGYVIQGDPVTMVGAPTIIRVGDGSTVGSGYTATIGAVLTGSSPLEKSDLGTLILTAENDYVGGTTITAGTLQLGNGGTSGSIVGDVINSGALVFNRADDVTYDGSVSGTGTLTKEGAGTLVLLGNITESGDATVSAGVLQIGNGGNQGTLAANIVNNSTLVFNRSDLYGQGSVISGTGLVEQRGPGILILGRDNSYSGGTLISNGTLQVGDGGTAGTLGTGDVVDNGILVFNRSDTFTVANVISGIGSVTQIGPGATVLTADNPYTGGTSVTAGTLAVGDAAHPAAAISGGGPVDIAAGATLGGYGSVTGTVTNSGTIAVANAVTPFAADPTGTFTINGDLTNSGLLQLGGTGVGNKLVIAGNYVGAAGATGALNTFLGTDGSPSDRIVIDGGSASGMTGLTFTMSEGRGRRPLQTASLSSKR
nr:autotransporter-associated beta strand repeat-containing protein [Mesorhizobium albiziae]